MVTIGQALEHDQVWGEEGVDYEYWEDGDGGHYTCCHCNKTSESEAAILNHLRSGAHEIPRYHCVDCNRKFQTMAGLQQHFESTGHSPPQQRLTQVMLPNCEQLSVFVMLGL